MSKAKIDLKKLDQLLRDGKKQREIAEFFGVSNAAVSKAKKKLKTCIVKNVVLEYANEAVKKNFDVIDQFQKINRYAGELLDLVMKWHRGDKNAQRILESREYKLKDPRELMIRVMGEIRQQLELGIKIFTTMYDMRAVQMFQEEVLEAIGKVSPDTRKEIVEQLNQRRAIRGDIKFS